jgi:hypothetical protein
MTGASSMGAKRNSVSSERGLPKTLQTAETVKNAKPYLFILITLFLKTKTSRYYT